MHTQDVIRNLRPLVSKSPQLSRLYRRLRDEMALRRQPAMTPLGFRFTGNAQMEAGVFEPAETRLVRSLLPSITTIINVGANVGYYCCIGLQAGKKVVAFEPMPINQRLMYRNVMANGWADGFECFPIALSDTSGLIEIYGSGTGASLITGWSGQTYSTVVPVSTLDTVMADRFASEPRLIIIDVEGAELRVLQGAQRALRGASGSSWLIEIEMMSHQPEGYRFNPDLIKAFEIFDAIGYTALAAVEAPRRVTIDEVREALRTGVRTFGTNNFLFVEAARVDEVLARHSAMH